MRDPASRNARASPGGPCGIALPQNNGLSPSVKKNVDGVALPGIHVDARGVCAGAFRQVGLGDRH